MSDIKKIIIITLIFIAAFVMLQFYWFQIRPEQKRADYHKTELYCDKESREEVQEENGYLNTYVYTRVYNRCMFLNR